MRASSLTAVLLALAVLGSPHSGRAAPKLTVTGRAALRLTRVARTPDRKVVIRGDLRDATLNTGVARQLLLLRVRVGARVVARARIRTDAQGAFSAKLALPRGTYHVDVRFVGSRVFAPASVLAEHLDVSKLAVALGIDIASELHAAKPRHAVPVVATVDGQPVDVPVVLFKIVDNKATRLGAVRTGRAGRGVITLATSVLGRPGPLTLEARFAGSDEINTTSTRREVVLVAPVTLTLLASQRDVEADGRIDLRGSVRDLSGPLSGATLAIHGFGRHLASARSDRRGRFRVRLKAAAFPPGQLELVARFTPAVVWRQRARSKPVRLRIRPVTPIPARAYLIPAGATLLVVVLLLAVRFRDRLFPARGGAKAMPKGDDDASDDDVDLAPPAPLVSGLEAGAAKRRTLRAQDFGIAGVVWDAADDCAVPAARVAVVPRRPSTPADAADGAAAAEGAGTAAAAPSAGTAAKLASDGHTLLSDADGRFAVESIAAGRYVVEVSKIGFMPERFDVELPHRGQLRGVRVRLVPVRIRVLEVYREAAFPLLPKPALWARWTPRDLLRHVRHAAQQWPGHARVTPLEQLSSLFEDAYWGPVPTPHTRVAEARDLAVALRKTGPSRSSANAADPNADAESDAAAD